MPIFKLWDHTRKNKILVVAATLKELIQKGANKLQIQPLNLKVVLEEDGTLVDEDEILVELGDARTILLLVPENESWYPARTEDVEQTKDQFVHTPTNPTFSETVESPLYGNGEELQRCPLPNFSQLVLKNIEGDSSNAVPETIWSILVAETANYYLGLFPSLKDPQEYRIIGSKMYRRYPCIGLDGQHPWSAFNKSLSQKIRHIRHQLKAKSRTTEDEGAIQTAPKKTFRVSQSQEIDDSVRHIEEMKKEWEKLPKNRNNEHLLKLFNITRQKRIQLLTSLKTRSLSSIIEQYPCLQDGQFILTEFSAIYGKERTVGIAKNLKVLQVAVEEYGEFDSNKEMSPIRMLDVIHFIEANTSLHQGKGSNRPKSIIEEIKDVPDSELESKLFTKESDGPHIRLFTSNGDITSIFIVGDGSRIRLNPDGGIITAVFKLLATYYIFDLEYPRVYAMCMGRLV